MSSTRVQVPGAQDLAARAEAAEMTGRNRRCVEGERFDVRRFLAVSERDVRRERAEARFQPEAGHPHHVAHASVFFEKRVLGIYGAGYLLLVAIYFFLFMLSGGQTIGMRFRQLVVVTRDDQMLDPRGSCVRGFGYFISIMPLMLGFVWALIDPEHLTWADKVSGTFVRKL